MNEVLIERMKSWPLPEGVGRVESAEAKRRGLVALTSVFPPHREGLFREVLEGMIAAGQWRPAELFAVNRPDGKGVVIARAPGRTQARRKGARV